MLNFVHGSNNLLFKTLVLQNFVLLSETTLLNNLSRKKYVKKPSWSP